MALRELGEKFTGRAVHEKIDEAPAINPDDSQDIIEARVYRSLYKITNHLIEAKQSDERNSKSIHASLARSEFEGYAKIYTRMLGNPDYLLKEILKFDEMIKRAYHQL